MKVLHLTTHVNMGGITMYILRLAEPLATEGVETHVFSSGGEMTELLHERGIKTHEAPIRTKSELHPKIYFHIPTVLRIIRENKIDVIHAHTRITQVMAFWIQKFTGIRVVTTCHGFYTNRLGRRLLPAWGDRVIGISHMVSEHLTRDFHVPEEKVETIHNGVDIKELDERTAQMDVAEIKKSYGMNPSDPVIGNIARLVEDKGHEYLIRAIAQLKEKYPTIRLLIVGDGRHRGYLEKLSRDLNVDENVLFLGTTTDIATPLRIMDVFAFPATWREGFGLSIMEAMSCRKPVIATKIWALALLIQNEVTGLLVEPKNVEVLETAIERILEDADLSQRLGEQGRQTVLKLFTIERMASDIASLYRGVLKKSKKCDTVGIT